MVRIAKGCKPSGRLLRRRLEELGYNGPIIDWGFPGKYADKYLALRVMGEAGVPVPEWRRPDFPVVARTERHRGGSGFWLCHTETDVIAAYDAGATHKMAYIPDAREFRVHVVDGKAIKTSEKIGGGTVKSFKNGARYAYPHDFEAMGELRRVAKAAVAALELRFGGVDILYKDGKFYCLECNSAPCLTSKSDTLERYATAFMGRTEEAKREEAKREEAYPPELEDFLRDYFSRPAETMF